MEPMESETGPIRPPEPWIPETPLSSQIFHFCLIIYKTPTDPNKIISKWTTLIKTIHQQLKSHPTLANRLNGTKLVNWIITEIYQPLRSRGGDSVSRRFNFVDMFNGGDSCNCICGSAFVLAILETLNLFGSFRGRFAMGIQQNHAYVVYESSTGKVFDIETASNVRKLHHKPRIESDAKYKLYFPHQVILSILRIELLDSFNPDLSLITGMKLSLIHI